MTVSLAQPSAAERARVSWRQALARQGVRQGALMTALLATTLVFPKAIPLGVYGLGATAGLALGLNAIGIVLVYRSNRIINFSQAAVGAMGALVFQASVTYRPLLRWFGFVCGGACTSRTSVLVNYWVSLAVGLAIPVLLSWVVYQGVIRRFSQAPRLLLTVATIFLGPALASFYSPIVNFMSTERLRQDLRLGGEGRALFPITSSFSFGGTVFRVTDVLIAVMAVGAMAALLAYLRYSRTGVAIRATAENPDRASTLGVDVGRVTSRIWLMAGALSGAAAVLAAASAEVPAANLDLSTLLILLSAAAMASMTSIPITLAACVVLGMVQQSTLWAFETTAPFLGSLSLVLAVTFVLQRGHASRGEIDLASTFATARETRPVPRELKDLPAVRTWRRAIAATGAVLFLGVPLFFSPSQVDAVTTYLVLGIVALSLLVLTGWAGQISLGQIALAGVGAYVAAVSNMPFLLAVVAAAGAGALLAVGIGLPALRLRGLHLAVISLALAVSVQQFLLNPEYAGKALPNTINRPSLFGISFEDGLPFYYSVLVFVVLTVLALGGLRRSRTARALLAARDNELAAQSLGIDLLRARLMAFAVSGGLAAFAGALFAYQQHAVQSATFGPESGVQVFQAAVVGGLGHLAGPLLGTSFLYGPSLFSLPSFIALIVTGAGALIVVLLVPGGLAQWAFDVRDSFLRRLAVREGIRVPALLGPKDDLGEAVAPLAPKTTQPGGAYVPARYRLHGQWAVEMSKREAEVG